VLVDEEKISRVLTNLIDNALKFTPDKGQVLITAGPAPGERGFVQYGVEDQGPGIAPEYREKIFERFSQGRLWAVSGAALGWA